MSGKEKVTALTLKDLKKNKEKIACMTAYDAAFGKVLDGVGIDVILVGDSVGMVVQGHETTVPVSVEDMIYHSKMVNRGVSRAMVMVDMPFMSYSTPTECLANAALLMKEGGAEFIKLEWGELEIDMVKRLTDCGIPVCAHLGLTLNRSISMVVTGFKVARWKRRKKCKKMLCPLWKLEQIYCFWNVFPLGLRKTLLLSRKFQ